MLLLQFLFTTSLVIGHVFSHKLIRLLEYDLNRLKVSSPTTKTFLSKLKKCKSEGLCWVKIIFQNYPRLANSVVYGSLYVGAEYSQQMITRKLSEKEAKKPIDSKSLGRYLIVGSLINSNIFYSWYKWLDGKYVGTQRKIIIKKLLLDQFVLTPPLYVIFYVTMSLLEGKEDIFRECKEKFLTTFSLSCVFWFPAQAINFLYLPNAARIVYLGLCSFLWMNILCMIKARNN